MNIFDTFLRHMRLGLGAAVLLCPAAAKAYAPDDSCSAGRWTYMAEIQGALSSGEHTPFWLMNNRQGLSSTEKRNGYLRAAIYRRPDSVGRFRWGVGADIAVPFGYTSHFVVQQLYGELRYRCLGLTVGSKETHGEFNDPRLSSGDLLYSGNARPIPQARFGIPDFTTIPGSRGWLAVKAHIAFGMFTDDSWQRDFTAATGARHTKDVLFHSKGAWLRLARPGGPWAVRGGLEMAAQFGGKSITGTHVTDMPTSLKDFLNVIAAQGGGSNTPMGEQTNVYGNHLGTWNLCVDYSPTRDWHLKAYYQHFFEDHSMLFFDYTWRDGLWGLQVDFPDNPFVSSLVYEFLYTKDQAGPVYWDHSPEIPEQVSGRDDYYNHSIYTGWQHWGMGIGNPLIISPIYNDNGIIRFRSNRIKGHHIGFCGSPLRELDYRVLFSYTRSWGTYDTPFYEIENCYNALLEICYKPRFIRGASATLSLGMDRGALLGNSYGAMLTITKRGIL